MEQILCIFTVFHSGGFLNAVPSFSKGHLKSPPTLIPHEDMCGCWGATGEVKAAVNCRERQKDQPPGDGGWKASCCLVGQFPLL